MDFLLLLARLALFGVFAVAGLTKLANLGGSRKMMRDFGLPEALARPAGVALPIIELLIAALLLPVATAGVAAVGAFSLLVLFDAGIAYNLARGRTPDCRCFGQIHASPVGPRTLIRNAVLAIVALPVAIRGLAGDGGASLVAWFGDMSGAGWALLLGGLVLAAVLAGIGWLLTHLLGQNGRLLVRLDALEAALGERGMLAPADADEEGDEGLPVGAPAPAFALTGLHGETMTLDALRAPGKPVLLVFTDPNCGPCNALMPDVGRWQREHAAKLTTAIITRGTADANRAKMAEHGVTHVLLQKGDEVADAYGADGTPTGVLVRPDGTIGSAAAPGGEAIRTLVDRAVSGRLQIAANGRRPAPRPVPKAAPAANLGHAAPGVALPDLSGKTVELADLKGSPTVVLFWNPGCGFCSRMLPDLKKWEAERGGDVPNLLVVSTGGVDENRAMGLMSPVVIDQGFATGREFGASGTPSAVLVDADGKIASGVAVGAPSVLGLLQGQPQGADAANGTPQPLPAETPKVGEPAPAVVLPDLSGKNVALANHRGTRTLVLFWNPGCGFCSQLLPELKQWEARPPKGAPKLLVLSSGTVEENRAMGLRSPVLIDPDFSAGTAFGADGTPSAVLVDARGNIASELAVGGPDVMKLARTTADGARQPATI